MSKGLKERKEILVHKVRKALLVKREKMDR
jgi:hypothetical protein